MAKNQLLPLLKAILLHFVLLIAINAKGSDITLDEIPDDTYTLRIFVSSSMSNNLLKEYATEAKKYNAILVFKGLPEGSFKSLSNLILSMQDQGKDEELSAIQIDDEAFERFNVTSVPSIVLSLNSECEPNTTRKLTYDKVDGNISIRSALEKFASSGDVRFAANKIIITNDDAK